MGYRVPAGRVSRGGWEKLEKCGFGFDASLFPAFWPNPFYLSFSDEPFRAGKGQIWEIPFSVISPFRIPLTLSYMKLIGWKIYKKMLKRYQLPNLLIFGCHLHDFWRLPGYNELSSFWKLIYARNPRRGFYILEQFLNLLRQNNYDFVTMGELVKILGKNQ